jgi:hypothetical protein
MAVWITEKDGYPHDVRVKAATIQSGRGSWRASVSVGVRPQPHKIVRGSLSAADFALVSDWIVQNCDVIIDFWDGKLDPDEALARLQRLP